MFVFLSFINLIMAGLSLSSNNEWWRLYMLTAIIFMCVEYIVDRIRDIEKLLKSEGRRHE